ncbi:MAG: pknB 29, partial [Planctomycetaceae bacterium]|nr:pknB 29 [Planctomycetaceae bacterium]
SFLQPSSRPESLGRIGHYEVLQVLGRGGFGIVLRAFDDVLQRIVALKVLAPTIAVTSAARKRFLREARSSAQVRHENVVQVYAVEEQPLPYLVMEFIPGETLQQRLDGTGPLDPREIVSLGRQIAEGLAAAHATGLIHRDIKPGNVLIEGGHQRVKITDFGLARAADDASLTQSGVLAGTPMYMAPEQARGDSLDHRADLFSLGSVLYVMASGRPPFRAATTYAVLRRVVEDVPTPIRDVIPEMPQWLAGVIAKLHAKNPADRFQSAREVADVLADVEARLKANVSLDDVLGIGQNKPVAAKSGRWKWLAAAALMLPILALGATEITGITTLLGPRPTSLDPQQATAAATARVGDAGSAQPRPPETGKPAAQFTNSLGMKFNLIPAGKFRMGTPPEEMKLLSEQNKDEGFNHMLLKEGPEHDVEISQPFYLGTTEVTIGQFRLFVKANPDYDLGAPGWDQAAFPQTDEHPVVQVSWHHAQKFCNWLSDKEGQRYRLPTEAEWEYSCRAGKSGHRYCFGNEDAELPNYAWYRANQSGGTHPVGQKLPNAWGLYDMHGNVFEHCQDWRDHDYYKYSPVRDPQGPNTGTHRVTRGGGWYFAADHCRNAFHSWLAPHERRDHVGFRVVRVAPPEGVRAESGQ